MSITQLDELERRRLFSDVGDYLALAKNYGVPDVDQGLFKKYEGMQYADLQKLAKNDLANHVSSGFGQLRSYSVPTELAMALATKSDTNGNGTLTYAEQLTLLHLTIVPSAFWGDPNDTNNDGVVTTADLAVPDRDDAPIMNLAKASVKHADWFDADRPKDADAWVKADGTLVVAAPNSATGAWVRKEGDEIKVSITMDSGTGVANQRAKFASSAVHRIEIFGAVSNGFATLTIGETDKPITVFSRDSFRTIYGGLDAETIYGTSEADTINSGGGNDTIYANGGNDSINGGAGNDHIFGDYGDDHLDGGSGVNTVYGSGGEDSFNVTAKDTIDRHKGDHVHVR